MVNKLAAQTVHHHSANCLIMAVIRYQPYLLHCQHVYQLNLASIPNGCSSRYVSHLVQIHIYELSPITWIFFLLYVSLSMQQCFSAMTLFYCAHWQSYVSGTLRLGKVDVTEAQCMIIIIHLISAVFGPGIWTAKVYQNRI